MLNTDARNADAITAFSPNDDLKGGAPEGMMEITPNMIAAGVARLIELEEFSPDRVFVVKEIFRAMLAGKLSGRRGPDHLYLL